VVSVPPELRGECHGVLGKALDGGVPDAGGAPPPCLLQGVGDCGVTGQSLQLQQAVADTHMPPVIVFDDMGSDGLTPCLRRIRAVRAG